MLFLSIHFLDVYSSKCINSVIIHSILEHKSPVQYNHQHKINFIRAGQIGVLLKTVMTTHILLFQHYYMLKMLPLLDHLKTCVNFSKQLSNTHKSLSMDGILQSVQFLTQPTMKQHYLPHILCIIILFQQQSLFNILVYHLQAVAFIQASQ